MPEQSGIYKYQYDILNRLIQIVKDDRIMVQYEYDNYGNRVLEKSEGFSKEYTYNELNQVQTIVNSSKGKIEKTRYYYDKRGNVTEIYNNDILTKSFLFDSRNQLKKITTKLKNRIYL